MRPKDFKRWRKSLGLSQKAAADTLGLKRRVVQYYEKGERDGKSVEIPKSVRLACYALSEGVSDYHGPREGNERAGDNNLRLVAVNTTPADDQDASQKTQRKSPRKAAKAEKAKGAAVRSTKAEAKKDGPGKPPGKPKGAKKASKTNPPPDGA